MKAENDTPSNAELLTEAVLDDTLNIDVYATDPEERGHHDRFMAAAAQRESGPLARSRAIRQGEREQALHQM